MANIFESNVPQDGVRATESAHRKIELQSPADLTYLIANVTKAAQEKIDQHLPPDAAPAGEDAMRKRVEQLVDEYIRTTFNAAKDNITINGMDTREIEEELAKAQEGEGGCTRLDCFCIMKMPMLKYVCCRTGTLRHETSAENSSALLTN